MKTPLIESLRNLTRIVIPEGGEMVNRTVAEAFQEAFAPGAEINEGGVQAEFCQPGVLAVFIEGEADLGRPEKAGDSKFWGLFQGGAEGWMICASHRHLLYGLFCRIRDRWSEEPADAFSAGRLFRPRFEGLYGSDFHLSFVRRFAKGYDPESALAEMARMGCRYAAVNVLPTPNAYEQGVNGEIYHRFYQYLPDIDQFVDTKLNRGIYPQEYLQANLQFLKFQSELAVKYGITPGMHVANPRSAPEEFFDRYPYLRGPRIDHTFRSYKPRYTMTLAHPLVRWHYAKLLENLLEAVPEIGFMMSLINDSGSGFEYTESLYAGRNGGPYMVREWRPHAEIAQAAAKLVIDYHRLMLDTGRRLNPEFRFVLGLNNIEEEKRIIFDGLKDGLDRLDRTQRYDSVADLDASRALEERGSMRVACVAAYGNYFIYGIPSPWKTFSELKRESEAGTRVFELEFNPPSQSPFDPNREVVHHFQFDPELSEPESILGDLARKWVGEAHAKDLIDLWKQSDGVSREMPFWALYGNQGFTWYRFWVRPFVPDIGKIPVKDRFYYEEYILTHFNNPHNVDFKADALWEIHTIEEMKGDLATFDEQVLPALRKVLNAVGDKVEAVDRQDEAATVFIDLQDRLRGYLCFARTLRNVAAWVVQVHGYLQAETPEDKAAHRQGVDQMVADEMENTRELLELWRTSTVTFMPIARYGEWMHDYGDNFGELLERKLELMEQYKDAEPFIDPNFMWKLPDSDDIELAPDIDPEEYIHF